MTDAEKEAVKQGQTATNTKTGNQAPAPDKLVLRTPEQIQTATLKQLESLSDVVSDQMFEAVETRAIEKLGYKILNSADSIAEGTATKILDFLPKLLKTDALMQEESELDRFLILVEAA